jgi:hypothetical protein
MELLAGRLIPLPKPPPLAPAAVLGLQAGLVLLLLLLAPGPILSGAKVTTAVRDDMLPTPAVGLGE